MSWAHASASALLALFIIAGDASAQQVIDSPGRYDVTVVAVPEFVWPGVPPLGPNAYSGEVFVTETGNGWNVGFKGETDSGDQLHIQAKFDSDWEGLTIGPFLVDGEMIPNAVIGIDVDNLEGAHVIGVGLVDGVEQRLNGQAGPAGTVENLQIH
jgi:hypothetical protein